MCHCNHLFCSLIFALAVISWRCVQNRQLYTAVELGKQYVWHHCILSLTVWLFILPQAVSGTLSDCSWELPVTHSLVLFSTCSRFTVFSKQHFSSVPLTCMAASGFRMNLSEHQWIFRAACHLFSPLCLKSHSFCDVKVASLDRTPPRQSSPPENDTDKKLGKPILIK